MREGVKRIIGEENRSRGHRQHMDRCAYSEWFEPSDGQTEAVEEAFAALHLFVHEHYGDVMLKMDVDRLARTVAIGNAACKLAGMVMVLAHEQAIHDQIVADCDDPEMREKARVFRRLAAVAVRSLFETPVGEKNAGTLLGRFLYLCHLGWTCMDARSAENFCDFFAARAKAKGGGLDTSVASTCRKGSSSPSVFAADDELLRIASRRDSGLGTSRR